MKLRLQTHQWCSQPKNWGGFGGAMAPLPPLDTLMRRM